MTDRKYLPSLGDLIDRLSIDQLKEVKLPPEFKEQYANEIQDIIHDIDLILNEQNIKIDGKTIRAICVMMLANNSVWINEADCRNGVEGSDLRLSHGLNGIRIQAKNRINNISGGSIDKKICCLAADFDNWKISWGDN